MLFGNDYILSMINKDIKEIEKKYDITVIFGAAVASLERGITKYSTDYDIRFLFYYNSTPQLPVEEYHNEERIRIREYFSQEKRPYDCIAMWEINAFFNFLVEPYISQGENYRLIQIVYETISSPYIFDSLGLYAKIEPFIKKCFRIDNEAVFLANKITEYLKKENVKLIESLNTLYYYTKLRWILDKGEMPPIHYYTLLQNEEVHVREMYEELLAQVDEWSTLQMSGISFMKDCEIQKPENVFELLRGFMSGTQIGQNFSYRVSTEQSCAHQKILDIVKHAIEEKKKRYYFMEKTYEENCY